MRLSLSEFQLAVGPMAGAAFGRQIYAKIFSSFKIERKIAKKDSDLFLFVFVGYVTCSKQNR